MTKPEQTEIFIFSALPCEAKPLISHFELKKDMQVQEFSLYRNAHYCLTVTGLGKTAMAAGVAYTLASSITKPYPLMLNIGIAGHKTHPVKQLFATEKIIDADSGKNYYPQLVYELPCASETLCTVSRAENHHYQAGYIYDMEASAFFETAARFTSSELLQCLKVISDNASSPTTAINAKQVSHWIGNHIDSIEKLLTAMSTIRQKTDTPTPAYYAPALEKWHFTHSQQIKLKQLLIRRQVVLGESAPDILNNSVENAKELIRLLEQELDSSDFTL